MKKLAFIIPALLAGTFLSGCIEEYGYVNDRPGYYADSQVDFYYSSGRPYSHSYGPLRHRDGRYYYSRGGRYVAYDRPTHAHAYQQQPSRTRNVRTVDRYERHGRYNDDRSVVITNSSRPRSRVIRVVE